MKITENKERNWLLVLKCVFWLDICDNVLIMLMSEHLCGILISYWTYKPDTQMDFAGNIWVPSRFCHSPGVKHHLTETTCARGIKVTEIKAQKGD